MAVLLLTLLLQRLSAVCLLVLSLHKHWLQQRYIKILAMLQQGAQRLWVELRVAAAAVVAAGFKDSLHINSCRGST